MNIGIRNGVGGEMVQMFFTVVVKGTKGCQVVSLNRQDMAEVPLSKAPNPNRSPGAVDRAVHRSGEVFTSVCV